jgi:predicted MFS family arabinose efflux permease
MFILGGITGALRGLSNDFISLLAATFLVGLISAATMPAVSVFASLSVSRQRQGLSQGMVATGGGLGNTIAPLISATILSPLLDGWRNVFFLYGGLFWLFTVSEPRRIKSADAAKPTPLRQVFSHVVHIKAIWLIGLTWLLYNGCKQGMTGYLPLYLRDSGWAAAAADGTLSVFGAVGAIAVIPLTMLSDRISSRKIFIFASLVTATIGVGLLSVIRNEIVWILVIALGVFFM